MLLDTDCYADTSSYTTNSQFDTTNSQFVVHERVEVSDGDTFSNAEVTQLSNVNNEPTEFSGAQFVSDGNANFSNSEVTQLSNVNDHAVTDFSNLDTQVSQLSNVNNGPTEFSGAQFVDLNNDTYKDPYPVYKQRGSICVNTEPSDISRQVMTGVMEESW